jgi:hypothetical protein
LNCPCLFPRLAEDGKEDGGEDSDNRYYNQELYQSETFPSQRYASFCVIF